MIKYFLEEKNQNVNSKDSLEWTPLHRSAYNGHLSIVKYLVDEKKADVNASQIEKNFTPLHFASVNGHVNVIEKLIEKGAKPNAVGGGNWTLLHSAIWQGHLDAAKVILEKGADINIRSSDGKTFLDHAIDYGHIEIVKFLVRRFAEKKQLTPLHWATEYRSLKVVKALFINDTVNVDARAENSVYHSCTSLHLAAEKCKVDIAEFLINKGADVNTTDNINQRTPLHHILKTSTKTNKHQTTDQEKIAMAKLLINKKANINAKDDSGWTPLHIAASKGLTSIVEFFYES